MNPDRWMTFDLRYTESNLTDQYHLSSRWTFVLNTGNIPVTYRLSALTLTIQLENTDDVLVEAVSPISQVNYPPFAPLVLFSPYTFVYYQMLPTMIGLTTTTSTEHVSLNWDYQLYLGSIFSSVTRGTCNFTSSTSFEGATIEVEITAYWKKPFSPIQTHSKTSTHTITLSPPE